MAMRAVRTDNSITARLANAFAANRAVTFATVPDGFAGKVLADIAQATGAARLVFVARDGQRLAEVERTLRILRAGRGNPRLSGLGLPAL